MAFIDKTDLTRYVDSSTIDQLTDNDDTLVDEAILDAQDRVKEIIQARYDIDAEFAKLTTARNRSLLKHTINIAIYFLFQRLYTNVLPEGRIEAFEQAETWLKDVYAGRVMVDMTKNDETNEEGWPLRWGSNTKKGSQDW